MSEREFSRLKIIADINERRLSVVQGAELAGISRRQMTRLVKAFRLHGAFGLISKKRGMLLSVKVGMSGCSLYGAG